MSTNPRQFALQSQATEMGNGNYTDNEIGHANGLVIRNIIIYHGTGQHGTTKTIEWGRGRPRGTRSTLVKSIAGRPTK